MLARAGLEIVRFHCIVNPVGVWLSNAQTPPDRAIRGLRHEAAVKAGEDPDRLSFLHAVRVVRRKLPLYGAIPPSGEEGLPCGGVK